MAANKMAMVASFVGAVQHGKEGFDAWRKSHAPFTSIEDAKEKTQEASKHLRASIARFVSAMMEYLIPMAKNTDSLKLSDSIFLLELRRIVQQGGIPASAAIPGVREVSRPFTPEEIKNLPPLARAEGESDEALAKRSADRVKAGFVEIWGSAPVPAKPAISAEAYLAKIVQTDTDRLLRIATRKAKNEMDKEEDLPLANKLELVIEN